MALATLGCVGDATTEPGDRDAVAGLQVVVTGSTATAETTSQVIILANGVVAGGPLAFPVGRATIIARPINDTGAPVSAAVAATLRLTVNVAAGNPAGLSFERDPNTPLAGVLTSTAAPPANATITVNLGAQRIADGVWPIGPIPVAVVIAPRPA